MWPSSPRARVQGVLTAQFWLRVLPSTQLLEAPCFSADDVGFALTFAVSCCNREVMFRRLM